MKAASFPGLFRSYCEVDSSLEAEPVDSGPEVRLWSQSQPRWSFVASTSTVRASCSMWKGWVMRRAVQAAAARAVGFTVDTDAVHSICRGADRSEERRVGKEGRSRRSPHH